jgi:hypothetical protein
MIKFDMKRILHSSVGRILLSILLGLGFACLFYRACKEKDCINFHGPVIQDIKNKTFEFDSRCYKYEPVAVKCDASETKKIIDFESTKTDPMTETFMNYMKNKEQLEFGAYSTEVFKNPTATPTGVFTVGKK